MLSQFGQENEISVSVDTGLPFRDYRYLYISLHKYIYIYICIFYERMNLLIFIFINKKFKVHIFYKSKYQLKYINQSIRLNKKILIIFFIVPTEMLILASTTEIGPYNLNCFGTFWRNTNLMASMVYFLDTDNTGTESIGLWLLSHAQFILFELGA